MKIEIAKDEISFIPFKIVLHVESLTDAIRIEEGLSKTCSYEMLKHLKKEVDKQRINTQDAIYIQEKGD